jgi:O-antigen/teichoic acid export membrane protein
MKVTQFKKDFFTLSFGNGLSQIIAFLFLPVLTRLYSPEQIGEYALFLAAIGILVAFSTLRLEYAIILCKTEVERYSVVFAIFFAGLVFAAIFSTVLSTGFLLNFAFIQNNFGSLWLGLFSVLILGIVNIIFNTLIFHGQIILLTKLKVLQSVIAVLAQISFSVIHNALNGLMLGYLVSCLAIVCVVALRVSIKSILVKLLSSKHAIFGSFKKFKDFIIFDTSNALIFNMYSSSIILVMSIYFNLSTLGLYALSERVLVKPVSIFVTSFTNIFYKKLAVLNHEDPGKISNILVTASNKISAATFIPFFLFVYFSKYFIPVVFGAGWENAYLYLYAISIAVYAKITVSPYSNVLKVIGMQKLSFKLNTILCIGTLIALFASVQWLELSSLWSILIFGLSSSAFLVSNVFIICRKANLKIPIFLILSNVMSAVCVFSMLIAVGGL